MTKTTGEAAPAAPHAAWCNSAHRIGYLGGTLTRQSGISAALDWREQRRLWAQQQQPDTVAASTTNPGRPDWRSCVGRGGAPDRRAQGEWRQESQDPWQLHDMLRQRVDSAAWRRSNVRRIAPRRRDMTSAWRLGGRAYRLGTGAYRLCAGQLNNTVRQQKGGLADDQVRRTHRSCKGKGDRVREASGRSHKIGYPVGFGVLKELLTKHFAQPEKVFGFAQGRPY